MSAAESGPSAAGDDSDDEQKYPADTCDGGHGGGDEPTFSDDIVDEMEADSEDVAKGKDHAKAADKTTMYWMTRLNTRSMLEFLRFVGANAKAGVADLHYYMRVYCQLNKIPEVSAANSQFMRCANLLATHRRENPTDTFLVAVKSVMTQLKEHFRVGKKELNRILAEDGIDSEEAAEGVRELLERGAIDVPKIIKLLSSRRPTTKELHILTAVFLRKLGTSFRIFDLDSRRVLGVAQLAAHFKVEEIVNAVHKQSAKEKAAEKLAVQILVLEAKTTTFVARSGDFSKQLPGICLAAIYGDEIVDAFTFHAAKKSKPEIVDALIAELCAKIESRDPAAIQFAKDCAEAVKCPRVYLAVAKCADAMMKKLPTILADELKADAIGEANVSAHKVLSEWPKSSPESQRPEWHQRHVKKPCTVAKTLKLAIELITDAHLIQKKFAKKIRDLRLLCEALCNAKLSFGPVKELKRVREKILELEGALHPKSGTVIDLVRCSLEVDGCENIVKVVEFLLRKTAPRDSDAGPLKAGEVRIRSVRVKNGFEGWLSDERPPHYRDVKINVSIKCKVGGSVRTLVGEIQVFGQGMGAFKDKSHGFYSVTRTADAWQMVEDMLANFSFAELRDSASMKLLTDAGFRETDKEKRQMAFEVVAVRSSVPLTVFKKVCQWYDADRRTAASKKKTVAPKKVKTKAAKKRKLTSTAAKKKSVTAPTKAEMERKPFCDVSDDFLHRVVARRADRNDFAETLDFLQKRMTAVGKWQSALTRVVASMAPVAWYIEEARDVSFKRHIADKLLPSPLPPAGSSWPMEDFSDYNILHVAAAACVRFGASPARVQYCVEYLPAPKLRRIGCDSSKPADAYIKRGGTNPVIEAALRAADSDPMPATDSA